MKVRHLRFGTLGIAAALVLFAVSCGSGHDAPPATTPTPAATSCSRASNCWEQLRPLGSGGHPSEPGSNDTPKWTPGKIPVGVQPILAFNGDLWMTSQTNAWSSGDGLDWQHYQKTDTDSRIWASMVFFKDRLWSIGGLHYDDRVPLNEIWSSRDGITWQKDANAEWSPRKQQTVVVFRDKLWLVGGADRVKTDFTTVHTLNDVWSSHDGLHWTQVAAAAPWPPLEGAHVVVFNDALYLVGAEGRADVWRSTDGATWRQLTAGAPWGARDAYVAIAFDRKLWVYGGCTGKSTNALNDVWYSTDGASWMQQTEHAPWGPRIPLSVVYKDRLWIYSGKHTGAKDSWGGDVWTMSATQ